MIRKLVRFSLVIGVLALLAIPMTAAAGGGGGGLSGPTSSIKIGSKASLVSSGFGGMTVFVQVSYSCFPAPFGFSFLQVTVSQPTGASGSNFGPAICDDHTQTVSVPVSSFFFPGFSPGAAAAFAVVCGLDCANDSREITVVAA